MPSIVGLALGAVFTGASVAAITVASYAIVIAASYAYGSYQAANARRAAKANYNDSLKDRTVMLQTTDAARSRLYGRVRNCDGILFKETHGEKKEYYTI